MSDVTVTGIEWLLNAPTVPAELMEKDEDELEQEVVLDDGSRMKATTRERLRNCGMLCHKSDWRTGRRVGYFAKCGLYLLCDRCREERAAAERDRVTAAIGDRQVWQLRVSAEEVTKTIRNLAASEYRRYPQPSGETVILHTDPEMGGSVVEQVEDLDWEALVATPKGSNWSGKLTKDVVVPAKENEAERGESKVVRVQSVSFDDPLERADYEVKEDASRCWQFATLATEHIPADLDSIGLLMREQTRHFVSGMENCGYVVRFFVYDSMRVYENEIDWEPYRSHIRKILHGYGSDAVADEGTYERHYKESLDA